MVEAPYPRTMPPTRLVLASVATALAVLSASGCSLSDDFPQSSSQDPSFSSPVEGQPRSLPPAEHVFVINVENKSFDRVYGPESEAPYLAGPLRSKGVLLENYYGTAHHSLGNYLAQISGQGPGPDIQADCQTFADFTDEGTVPPGQYIGRGCVFPAETPTLVGQLDKAGLTWRGYMEDMGTPCRHPELNAPDDTQAAEADDQYATRHNPFMYFHSIIDRQAYCEKHVVDLENLRGDLLRVRTTRNLSYISPDLCSDGHDAPCVDGRPGGLESADDWLREWVPLILRSPAFRRDGVLIITADESDGGDGGADACCDEQPGPNAASPGLTGMGGGRIGTVVISRWTKPGSTSVTPYNHYSLLASLEDLFGLNRLGYAAVDGLSTFGTDVYGAYRP